MNVSIVIPAYNAATTIRETLDSLLAQTHTEWEAIIIDDGSIDSTAAIAEEFAGRDARFRVVRQTHRGVSAARNAGIDQARFDWLMFLDADDWLSRLQAERLTGVLLADTTLDGAYCGWAHVAPDGTYVIVKQGPEPDDLFVEFASTCAFAIHTCIVRRSIVAEVGGFDTSLQVCEDWDLWQRIARTGARFGSIREPLALCRMRPASASLDGRRLLLDGLRVIARGHEADPRVHKPHPSYAAGAPKERLAQGKLYLLCWAAGLVLGRGEDPRFLLEMVRDERDPSLDPAAVAETLFDAVPFPKCKGPSHWLTFWNEVQDRIDDFLLGLEEHCRAFGLARRARRALEQLIVESAEGTRPFTIGSFYAVTIPITQPIPDLRLPSQIERVDCLIDVEGERIGTIELPAGNGHLPSEFLADAIAANLGWDILGRFFARSTYPDLSVERQSTGLSIKRGSVQLAEGIHTDKAEELSQVHESIGWTVFLQEVWGRQDWELARFYDPRSDGDSVDRRCAVDGRLTVEISQDLPDALAEFPELEVLLTVGGAALGVVTIPVKQDVIRAQELRAALTEACGTELCHVVVREALLGKPLDEGVSLRERLASAASLAGCQPAWLAAPGSGKAISPALLDGRGAVVLGRRTNDPIGTSASRRALIPATAASDALSAAFLAGEPVIQVPTPGASPELVIYAPDLIVRQTVHSANHGDKEQHKAIQSSKTAASKRNQFEMLFATRVDPWDYTNAYEQTKYEQTLSMLPPAPITRALEVGCAEGLFTAQLAPRVDHLVSADVSEVALERAAKRCLDLGNVEFVQLDLAADPLPGRFDLIVCSEMLYYLDNREALERAGAKLLEAVEPGGYLLTAHANLVVDEPDRTGFDWDHAYGAKVIGETLAGLPGLHRVKELRTPLYRIQLFQRESDAGQGQSDRTKIPRSWFEHFRRKPSPNGSNHYAEPEIVELNETVPLPPQFGAHVLWGGGEPERGHLAPPIVTERLPILMYHRVAPTGSPAMAQYRVTPEAFEQQLHYLSDSGYYSVSFEDWLGAARSRKPLPGRAVMITFDDGYLDFFTFAWPLLKRFGFTANVFLVAQHVGESNRWDEIYGENVPLMGWKEILELQDEGVEFGSHSLSHRPLLALSVSEVACEAARSRSILQRGLGRTVKSFAYPHGDNDRVIRQLVGACGYIYGLTTEEDMCSFSDNLLALPRIQVSGRESFQQFVQKVSS